MIAQIQASKIDLAGPRSSTFDRYRQFFGIFHPWDFIVSTENQEKPRWITVSKYPLDPEELYERWSDPDQLIGVRFKSKRGATTSYLMIDIDINSSLHPYKYLDAFKRMVFALEDIGLCRYLLVLSSASGGLHLYFPLPEPLLCYGLALAVKCKLENEGFKVEAGQLEIFPNVKTPGSLYNAHRLPLQTDSYILDADFQPVHSDLNYLIQAWYEAAENQDVALLKEAIATARLIAKNTKSYLSGNAIEWKERLQETLKIGWTGASQTNQIIKVACTYARVFLGMEWDSVFQWVLGIVVTLPGYQQFCKHRHEIKERVKDWVKSNRKSGRYYPYRSRQRTIKTSSGPSNEERAADALTRIKNAIAAIVEQLGKLPEGVRERQILICEVAKCSASTLRKHLTLWHPTYKDEGIAKNDSDGLSAILEEPINSAD